MRIKKLDLYLIKSFLGPFIVTFFVVLFAFVLQHFWLYMDEIVGKDLGFVVIAQYFLLIATTLMPLTLPLGLMLAAIMTFGSLGEHFELVAIKSSGISLFRFMRPLAVLALGVALISFLVNNYIVPVVNLKTYSLLYDMRESKPAFNIKEGAFNRDFDGYSIRVGKKHANGKNVEDILIYDHVSSRGNNNVVTAKKGKLFTSSDGKYLVFELKDGWRYNETGEGEFRQHTRTHFDKWRKVFDLSKFNFKRTQEELFKNNELMMNVGELYSQIDSNNRKRAKEFEFAFQSLGRFVTVIADTSKEELKKYLKASPNTGQYKGLYLSKFSDSIQEKLIPQIHTNLRTAKSYLFTSINESVYNQDRMKVLKLEFHRKFALATACLLLFFIGAPLGAIIRKGGIGMPIVVGVLFFAVYLVIGTSTEKLAKQNAIPIWLGIWAPTLILLPVAILVLIQARNDSKLFSIETYSRLWNRIKKLFPKKNVLKK